MTSIFQKGNPFVGQVEEDHCRAQNAALSQHIYVHQIANANQHKDEHLPADALEAHGAGQLLVRDGAHDPGDIVHRNKGNQRVEEPVRAAQKPADKAA